MPTQPELPEPGDVSLPEAFTVLRETLFDLEPLGRPATGSEVRLGLKRRTYGGFDPRPLGFKRFREFLNAARDAGHIEIDDGRKGDVAVRLPGAIYADSADSDGHRRIRSDLWRAVSDWSHKSTHVAELSRDRVVSFPPLPVPLEPSEFADLRRRRQQNDPDLVEVPPVPQPAQVEWMKAFAEEAGLAVLSDTLTMANPTAEFMAKIRADTDLRRAWGQVLSQKVRRYVLDWTSREPGAAAFNPFVTADTTTDSDNQEPKNAPLAPSSPLFKTSVHWVQRDPDLSQVVRTWQDRVRLSPSIKHRTGKHSELRQLLHNAIDRMPEAELRKINIPVGYLLDEE